MADDLLSAEAEFSGPPSPLSDGRFRLLAACWMGFAGAYALASAAGAPARLLSVAYYIPMAAIPVLALLAHRATQRHPEARDQERLWRWLSYGAYLWTAGSFLWLGYYLHDARSVFGAGVSVGPWDPLIDAAYLCALIGVVVGLRDSIHVRLALADGVVVGAAGLAAVAAFVNHGLEHGTTVLSLITLIRPILGISLVTLIATAAAGARRGLPLSTALIGLGEAFLYIGSLIYAYGAVQNHYAEDRWADLFYTSGACIAICAALLVILRVDRPVFAPSTGIPGHPMGSRAALMVAVAAAVVSVGTIGYGYAVGAPASIFVGCAAVLAIVTGGWLRSRSTYDALERAWRDRDAARLAAERERQALIDLLAFVDERTEQRFRELLRDAGSTLAEAVRDHLADRERREHGRDE